MAESNGYFQDQKLTPQAARRPPPLPPRNYSTNTLSPYSSPYEEAPPPYDDELGITFLSPGSRRWTSHDPRSSSTQSLLPSDNEQEDNEEDPKRRLLLVYIHGFMGDETSFQSFPAHVHNLVSTKLKRSHLVHTKIYPRYRSRNKVEAAAEEFSKWLAPHESPTTDVILLAHSMGGLVSAEIVLLPPHTPATGQAFRHDILGTINFDVPFLGMHPGVIGSGIQSLFRPAPASPQQSPSGTGTNTPLTSPGLSPGGPTSPFLSPPMPGDPTYNPSFANDIHLPVRKGWENTLHFINKHSDGLRKATKQAVKSHVQFGGAMADYRGLKSRYTKIRSLEAENADYRSRMLQRSGRTPPRVRFVNYYTASTGIPKPDKERQASVTKPVEMEMQDMSLAVQCENQSAPNSLRSPSRSPRISVDEHRGDAVVPQPLDEPDSPETATVRSSLERPSIAETSQNLTPYTSTTPSTAALTPSTSTPTDRSLSLTTTPSHSHLTHHRTSSLPPIPPLPTEPPFPTASSTTDRTARKIAEKEHSLQLKAYKRAVKERNAIIKDHQKLEAYRLKEEEKARREEEKARRKMDVTLKRPGVGQLGQQQPEGSQVGREDGQMTHGQVDELSGSLAVPTPGAPATATPAAGPQKDRKFCVLPSKDSAGNRDPCWIRVFMEGVDEVGAHCGLFFVNTPTYEGLVVDVGERILRWIRQ